MKINPRQEAILYSLSDLRFASRSQLTRLHNLGSKRNTSRIMANLKPYVSHLYDSEYIYYLNKEGAALVGYDGNLPSKAMHYEHTLLLNDLRIHYRMPDTWKTERTIKVPEQHLLIRPDAIFKAGGNYTLVEADNTQHMRDNKQKVIQYSNLKKSNVFETFPQILWITTTEIRRQRLSALCRQYGLDCKVYLPTDF